MIDLEHN